MATLTELRKRRAESDRGAILVLTAMVILLLLFIAAFSTDLGAWYRQTEEQQRAADVGSLNGISAYNRGTAAFMSTVGVTDFQSLTGEQAVDAERDGLSEAVLAIQALLETSGLRFTTPATFDIAADPRNFNQESTAVIVADDGTIVTITRSWVRTGGTDANPIYSPAIDVEIQREGEQYFSNLLRDAPTIIRGAQSLLSNCGATCNNPITIDPPFLGFEGQGDGDGYGPLLVDSDDDGRLDQAWAVNHHRYFNGRPGGAGSIICVDMNLREPCETGAIFPLIYETANRPVEYVAPDGKLYFAARDTGQGVLSSAPAGLACFDTRTRDYCSTPFVSLWPDTPSGQWPNRLTITGPFEYEGRLYMFSQDGEGVCVTHDLTPCGAAGFALQELPLMDQVRADPFGLLGNYSRLTAIIDGEFISDGRLILSQTLGKTFGVGYQCVELSSSQGVITPCGSSFSYAKVNNSDNITFLRYDTRGNPTGLCYLEAKSGDHQCVNASAQPDGSVPGLVSGLSLVGEGNYSGDAYSWKNKRTFFSGGFGNYVGCWNWETAGPCTDGPLGSGQYMSVDGSVIGNEEGAATYDFAQVSDRCIIGLGHYSQFFSFDPVGMGPCLDVQITTLISPCTCSDGSNRWGAVTLPANLLNDVTYLEATVFSNNGGSPGTLLLGPVDLLDSDGALDLTILNEMGNPDNVFLRLDADSEVDDGVPRFTEPYNTNLEISVSPTLTE